MPSLRPFRRSTYLTLAFACGCVGYAEFDVLPEAAAFAVVVVSSLVVLYRVEERVPLLSIPDANKLGAGVGLLCVLWIAFRFVREARVGSGTGWQLLTLAVFGPILMAAIPAKLVRAEKHVGDYWTLHGVGLILVVLAGALADDTPSVALMAGYATSAVWSLTLFLPARSGGLIPPVPSRAAAPPPLPRAVGPASREVLSGFGRVGVWSAAAGATAVVLFLLTPRSPFGKLDVARPRMEIGYSADSLIDLNRVGNLRANPEVAFEVFAEEADGRPKDDLSASQRWRGRVLANYAKGLWTEGDSSLPEVAQSALTGGRWSPPDLGPNRFRITFAVPTKLRGRFLADPVAWAVGQPVPVASLDPDGIHPWFSSSDGSLILIPRPATAHLETRRYVQYTRPPAEPDLGPGFQLARPLEQDDAGRQRVLVQNPVPRVKDYGDDLLARLIRDGTLPAAARPRAGDSPAVVRLLPPPEHHEAIARAFRNHLATTPTLAYSTKLQRANGASDPVEDFLFDTRVGHCERFASALVLLLRSQGVPAVLVLGFKGCESLGDGRYAVRQDFAHAWAEALVSRPGGAPGRGPAVRTWHWLGLDPEPLTEARVEAAGEGWLQRVIGTTEHVLFNYTTEQRNAVVRSIRDFITRADTLGVIGGAIALILFVPRVRLLRRRSRGERPGEVGWFGQLLVVLAAHGYAPSPGETPLEFARTVRDSLLTRPTTTDAAAVPVEWAEAYYDERFGGKPIPDGNRAILAGRLAELRDALNRTHP